MSFQNFNLILKSISFLLLLVSLTLPTTKTDTLEQNGGLDSTLYALIYKNNMEINSYLMSYFPLMSEKENLLNTFSFDVSPSIRVGSNEVSTVLKGGIELKGWAAVFDVDPLSQQYHNSCGIMAPLLSNKQKRSLLLDSLVNIEQKQALYQIEKILLEDFKSLWGITLEIMKIEDEIKVRDCVGKRIDSTGMALSEFVKAGYTSKNSIHPLRIVFLENRMQKTLLQQQTELLKKSLESLFQIPFDKIDMILGENRVFINKLADTCTRNETTGKTGPSVDDLIDSLSIQKTKIRRAYDTHTRYELKAGPVMNFTGNLKNPLAGVGTQLNISFIKQNIACKTDDIHSSIPQVPSIEMGMDHDLESEMAIYVQKIDSEIEIIFQELEVGNRNSISLLNDLYSRIINTKIDSVNLRYSYITSKISWIRSLEDVSMRSRLQEIYLKSKRFQ